MSFSKESGKTNERHDQVPDGSLHPAEHRNSFGVDRTMAASPDEIFDAWINHFDTWFASPGEVSMNAVPGAPYWFDVYHQGEPYALRAISPHGSGTID